MSPMMYADNGQFIYRFVCVVSAYCAGGCIAKGCTGSRGADIIPNAEFWKMLPTYTKVIAS